MKLTHQIKENICIISMEGHLIDQYSLEFRLYTLELLEDDFSNVFIINLKRVIRVDSAGLEQFVLLHKRAKEKQIPLALCDANELINGVLQATRLDKMLLIYDTEKDAITALNTPPPFI